MYSYFHLFYNFLSDILETITSCEYYIYLNALHDQISIQERIMKLFKIVQQFAKTIFIHIFFKNMYNTNISKEAKRATLVKSSKRIHFVYRSDRIAT